MATALQERTYFNCISSSAGECFRQQPEGHAIRCSLQARNSQSHHTQRCLYMASSRMVSGAATVLPGPPQLGARRRTVERTMDGGVSVWRNQAIFTKFKLKTKS